MQVLQYALFFMICSLISSAVTAVMRRFALSIGVIAKRDSRRRHDRDIPLLGGAGIYAVLSTVTLLAWLAPQAIPGLAIDARAAVCFLSAITIIFGVGVIDDCVELKAPPKFVAQFLAAALILVANPNVPEIFADLRDLPDTLVSALLILWIVGVTNAMNMIDGLDGLCAGVSGISSFTIAMILITAGAPFSHPVAISLALAGAALGFLTHNFNPAKIFLGDSGSLLLGFTLAATSTQLDAKRSLFVSISTLFFLLGLPLMDILLSMIRRKRQRRSMFQGDRSHIHHRLQQLGLTHRGAVLFLWSISAYLNLVAFILAQVPSKESAIVYALSFPMLGFWLATLYFMEKRLSLQNARYSHLFMKEQTKLIRSTEQIRNYIHDVLHNPEINRPHFILIVLNSSEFLKQMSHERPTRIVEFYMELYSILRARLRGSDLVARISDTEIIAVLAHTSSDGRVEQGAIQFLAKKIRSLEEAFGVYQTRPDVPEGFRVLYYPKDVRAIAHILKIPSTEISAEELLNSDSGPRTRGVA